MARSKSKPLSSSEILARIELVLMRKQVMAAIDTLNSQVESLAAVATKIEGKVTALEAAQGVPEDQVAAVSEKVQEILDSLATVAA